MQPFLTCMCGRCLYTIALLAIAIAVNGCASGPSVVGRWQAVEGTASVNLTADGTFEAIDNQGMAASGAYRLVGSDGIQFEVLHGGHEVEVIDAQLIREDSQLTLIFSGGEAVETYQRIP